MYDETGKDPTLTVNPLEIKAVLYKRSTALSASVLSGAFLHAAYKTKHNR